MKKNSCGNQHFSNSLKNIENRRSYQLNQEAQAMRQQIENVGICSIGKGFKDSEGLLKSDAVVMIKTEEGETRC